MLFCFDLQKGAVSGINSRSRFAEHLTAQSSRVHQRGLTGTSGPAHPVCISLAAALSTSTPVTRWVRPRLMALDPRWDLLFFKVTYVNPGRTAVLAASRYGHAPTSLRTVEGALTTLHELAGAVSLSAFIEEPR